jgi:hypothetical protein
MFHLDRITRIQETWFDHTCKDALGRHDTAPYFIHDLATLTRMTFLSNLCDFKLDLTAFENGTNGQ